MRKESENYDHGETSRVTNRTNYVHENINHVPLLFICDTAVPPGPPVARVESTTDHSINVEWDPPADNGGGEVFGYHVEKVKSSSHL